jgi:thiamine-phosphate pyrophosphorylase
MVATLADEARRLQARQVMRRRLPTLWLVTDWRRLPNPLPAARALPRGAGVILRHYEDPNRRLIAATLAQLCRQRGLVLLVAGDAGLAAAVGAAGVHLPEAAGRQVMALRRRRPGWVISLAAHSLPALLRARGADFALLSPVFATGSHPGASALGPLRFTALCRRSPVPVLALGGMNQAAAVRLRGAGQAGFAAIDGLRAAPSNRLVPTAERSHHAGDFAGRKGMAVA